jgi:hypothetical protein
VKPDELLKYNGTVTGQTFLFQKGKKGKKEKGTSPK